MQNTRTKQSSIKSSPAIRLEAKNQNKRHTPITKELLLECEMNAAARALNLKAFPRISLIALKFDLVKRMKCMYHLNESSAPDMSSVLIEQLAQIIKTPPRELVDMVGTLLRVVDELAEDRNVLRYKNHLLAKIKTFTKRKHAKKKLTIESLPAIFSQFCQTPFSTKKRALCITIAAEATIFLHKRRTELPILSARSDEDGMEAAHPHHELTLITELYLRLTKSKHSIDTLFQSAVESNDNEKTKKTTCLRDELSEYRSNYWQNLKNELQSHKIPDEQIDLLTKQVEKLNISQRKMIDDFQTRIIEVVDAGLDTEKEPSLFEDMLSRIIHRKIGYVDSVLFRAEMQAIGTAFEPKKNEKQSWKERLLSKHIPNYPIHGVALIFITQYEEIIQSKRAKTTENAINRVVCAIKQDAELDSEIDSEMQIQFCTTLSYWHQTMLRNKSGKLQQEMVTLMSARKEEEVLQSLTRQIRLLEKRVPHVCQNFIQLLNTVASQHEHRLSYQASYEQQKQKEYLNNGKLIERIIWYFGDTPAIEFFKSNLYLKPPYSQSDSLEFLAQAAALHSKLQIGPIESHCLLLHNASAKIHQNKEGINYRKFLIRHFCICTIDKLQRELKLMNPMTTTNLCMAMREIWACLDIPEYIKTKECFRQTEDLITSPRLASEQTSTDHSLVILDFLWEAINTKQAYSIFYGLLKSYLRICHTGYTRSSDPRLRTATMTPPPSPQEPGGSKDEKIPTPTRPRRTPTRPQRTPTHPQQITPSKSPKDIQTTLRDGSYELFSPESGRRRFDLFSAKQAKKRRPEQASSFNPKRMRSDNL